MLYGPKLVIYNFVERRHYSFCVTLAALFLSSNVNLTDVKRTDSNKREPSQDYQKESLTQVQGHSYGVFLTIFSRKLSWT